MPIALHLLMVATLGIPAVPAAMTPSDCTAGDFTARTEADLVKIKHLEAGPRALADIGLASAKGAVDSSSRSSPSVASGVHARAGGARHAAPGDGGPDEKRLAPFRATGLATVAAGTSSAHATWDDTYRCGASGPLTRASTELGGLSLLDSGITADDRRTSLMRIGPTGAAQSATDLIDLGKGKIGVRSGAGVELGDISLLEGTPQEISIKVVRQPALEVVAGEDRHRVDYRPAVLRVSTPGKPARILDDAASVASFGLLGAVGDGPPSALEARISLGAVRESRAGRQVQADAATLRVEVTDGSAPLLDVALGQLSVAACAPEPVFAARPIPHGQPDPEPAATSSHTSSPHTSYPPTSPASSPSASVPAPAPEPTADPVPVLEPSAPVSGAGGGDLALTGSDVSVFGFAGAGLILAGLLAMVLTRRRRPRWRRRHGVTVAGDGSGSR